MRRTIPLLVALAALNAACAAPFTVHGRPYGSVAPRTPPPDVTGRWDNVMMLAPGSHVVVLLMDGARAEGTVTAASATGLTVLVAAGPTELAAERVARVDRVSSRTQSGLSGALHGLGAVGVAGLLGGRVPPARLFAAAGVIGAEAGIHAAPGGGVETIYVARQVRR